MQHTNNLYPTEKLEMYTLLKSQFESLFEGEYDQIANLSNSSALLNEALTDINWVGFYLIKNNELILGPFQGKLACIHIPIGKGVCGTAVANRQIQLVPDVHEFPGHIACDGATNSEIVIPLYQEGNIVGVLDIDSTRFGRFDQVDCEHLECIARLIEKSCRW